MKKYRHFRRPVQRVAMAVRSQWEYTPLRWCRDRSCCPCSAVLCRHLKGIGPTVLGRANRARYAAHLRRALALAIRTHQKPFAVGRPVCETSATGMSSTLKSVGVCTTIAVRRTYLSVSKREDHERFISKVCIPQVEQKEQTGSFKTQ